MAIVTMPWGHIKGHLTIRVMVAIAVMSHGAHWPWSRVHSTCIAPCQGRITTGYSGSQANPAQPGGHHGGQGNVGKLGNATTAILARTPTLAWLFWSCQLSPIGEGGGGGRQCLPSWQHQSC